MFGDKGGMGIAAGFLLGRNVAGTKGTDANNAADKKIGEAKVASAVAEAVSAEGQKEVMNWRIYANRLNVHLAARKMSEATLLEELKKANISHPLATEEGFAELFDNALAAQYAELDRAKVAEELSPFDKKSFDEVGKERADVK